MLCCVVLYARAVVCVCAACCVLCCVVFACMCCAVCACVCCAVCVLAVLSCVALRVLVCADDGRRFLPYAYVCMVISLSSSFISNVNQRHDIPRANNILCFVFRT